MKGARQAWEDKISVLFLCFLSSQSLWARVFLPKFCCACLKAVSGKDQGASWEGIQGNLYRLWWPMEGWGPSKNGVSPPFTWYSCPVPLETRNRGVKKNIENVISPFRTHKQVLWQTENSTLTPKPQKCGMRRIILTGPSMTSMQHSPASVRTSF